LIKATTLQSGGFLVFELNQNIAWFWTLSNTYLYILLSVIIVILFYFYLQAFKKVSVLVWPWALIIIGAISNLLDRIYQGGVIDFINFFGLTVINLSDIYISLGVAWLLFDELKKNKRIKV
jgi:signal peptidase II